MSHTKSATMLSESEVRERLQLCEDPDIVEELYQTGQRLIQDTIDRIRSLESKATSFAAYGAAIATFLVTSASAWAKLGNECSLWIAFFAGLCGLMCTIFCVKVLKLRQYEVTSEDEWLKAPCLTGSIHFLKRYRIFTTWGMIDSHIKTQDKKALEVRRAEIWLTGAVGCLVFLLFQLACIRTTVNSQWVSLWHRAIHYDLCVAAWQHLAGSTSSDLSGLGNWCCGLVLCLILGGTLWRIRRIRP